MSEKYQNRSVKNKDNRGKQVYGSSHGAESYAQKRHNEGFVKIFYEILVIVFVDFCKKKKPEGQTTLMDGKKVTLRKENDGVTHRRNAIG
uniref:Uncharacterized protein n=1 Tax=Lactuca sativa TaxID=4236 RepID=A0A9R1XDF5_LACSA|nr:hypothetical protein LSAT_V11C500280540 [Lactuca sativa]